MPHHPSDIERRIVAIAGTLDDCRREALALAYEYAGREEDYGIAAEFIDEARATLLEILRTPKP